MPNDPAWTSSSYSVMGDEDRTEFHFNEDFSDDELIELLERNPRIALLCDWMSAEALKNGWEWDVEENITYTDPETQEEVSLSKDDYLESIHGYEKLHRAIMFARLHGTSLCVGLNDNPDLKEPSSNGIYQDFYVYHRTSGGHNGWKILREDLDSNGDPLYFTLYIHPIASDGGAGSKLMPTVFKVHRDRCIVFKNPKKGERWGGTPSSKLVAHAAQLEELMLKLMGKHAINVVDAFFHVKNCKSQEQAEAIHAQLGKKPLDELYTNGVELEPMRCEVQGDAQDFSMMIEILKDYMACAMRVSRQLMDGAPEGTLSSAEYNTLISYSVIEAIQTHYKPYIEDLFELLGFKNPNFEWVDPMKIMQEQQQQMNGEENGGNTPQRPSA